MLNSSFMRRRGETTPQKAMPPSTGETIPKSYQDTIGIETQETGTIFGIIPSLTIFVSPLWSLLNFMFAFSKFPILPWNILLLSLNRTSNILLGRFTFIGEIRRSSARMPESKAYIFPNSSLKDFSSTRTLNIFNQKHGNQISSLLIENLIVRNTGRPQVVEKL